MTNETKRMNLSLVLQDATSFNQSIDFVGSSLENAQGMFDGAAKFRQNLCSWGADIVAASPDGRNVVLDIMFDGTDCPDINEGFVDTYANPPGPFCFPCSTSSSSALLSAMKSWLALSVVGALAVAM